MRGFGLTNQFKYCTNNFRMDTWENCDYGCKYCFANNRKGGFEKNRKEKSLIKVNTEEHKKVFIKAFEKDREYKDVLVESLQHRVPLHVGGMADPFSYQEMNDKHTLDMIKFCNKYNYPMVFSTKTAYLSKEHWEVLNPNIHAFQISILGYDDEFIRRYESRTPLINKRIEFIKELKNRGFWVGIRIQPIIDMEQVEKLITATKDYVDFYTAEHLKVPMDSKELRELFKDIMENNNYKKGKYSRHYELPTERKIENIEKIKELAHPVKVGSADNDCHHLSSDGVRSCCGVDTIGKEFDNYIKYNTGYFISGEYNKDNIWFPKNSIRKCCNGDSIVDGLYTMKEYVTLFENKYYGKEFPRCSSCKEDTLKYISNK